VRRGYYAACVHSMYPHVAAAVHATAGLLDTLKTVERPECVELEARLGVRGLDGKFHTGVDKVFAARVLCKLETATCWTRVSDWTEQVDRFYALPSGASVRTSTIAGVDASSGQAATTVVHITKHELGHADFAWVAPPGADTLTSILCAQDGSVHEARVSIKHELPVPEADLPDRVDTMQLVRIKQRKSFVYASPGGGTWSYDVTLVYAASTYTAALELVRLGTSTQYEIEIECVAPVTQHSARGTQKLALSLLLKIADLFERDEIDVAPLARSGFELRAVC
jgi:hypothetical protein